VLLKYYPIELVVASVYFTAKRLLLQFYGALSGKGASGRFTVENSMFHAVAILLRAWCSALSAVPQVLRQRWKFARQRRIGRREFYRLIREFGISASEIALKD
jgi:hypothetical protein